MTSRTPDPSRVVRRDRVGTAELDRVRAVIAAATETDGVGPLDEAAMLDLANGTYLLVPAADSASPGDDPGPLAGFARLLDGASTASADLVTHPAYRRRGIGNNLLATLTAETAGRELRIWAHGPHPAAAPLAAAHRMRAVRELWRMSRPLLGPDAPELPEPSLPAADAGADAVRIRTFRPGEDDAGWLRANARAFANHPEQGRLGEADLLERMSQPWFSASGFFVAERDGRIIGFHWTKVHPTEGQRPPVGEIYVLGVAEPMRGLGTALAITGLRHLAGLGVRTAILFTESDNEPAIGLYRKLGFSHTASDVMYAGPAA